MDQQLNDLSPSLHGDHYKREEDQKYAAASSRQSVEKDTTNLNEHTAPPNHLAVLKICAWDPASPQYTNTFTSTINIRYDDGMIPSRKHLINQTSRLSHISEIDEETFDENDVSSYGRGDADDSEFVAFVNEAGGNSVNTLINKNEIRAGSYVGVHLEPNPSLLAVQQSWNVDDTVRIRNRLNLVPHTDIKRLVKLVENNHPSVQTLIMDGLPSSTFTSEDVRTLAIALGERNTNIQSVSIRYSNINDEVASELSLALVGNTTLKWLSLEGNQLTSVTAKKFFNVICQSNKTLQYLNLKNNVSIDEETLEAIHQFMQQRKLKRKMTQKRGEGEGDDDGIFFDSVTIVCDETIIDGTFDPNVTSSENLPEQSELNISMAPLPNESFMHYMERMNLSKETPRSSMRGAATALLASQRLHAQSRRHLLGYTSSHLDSTLPLSRGSSLTSRSSAPSHHDSKDIEKKGESINAPEVVGMHQINEVAPDRQNRTSMTRNRAPMTESQRMARLLALTDGEGASSKRAATFGRTSRLGDDFFESTNTVEIAMGNGIYQEDDMRDLKRRSPYSAFGLDDPEMRTDCFACTCLIVLTMIMFVMVIIYVFLL